jgi:hypothetical protein
LPPGGIAGRVAGAVGIALAATVVFAVVVAEEGSGLGVALGGKPATGEFVVGAGPVAGLGE